MFMKKNELWLSPEMPMGRVDQLPGTPPTWQATFLLPGLPSLGVTTFTKRDQAVQKLMELGGQWKLAAGIVSLEKTLCFALLQSPDHIIKIMDSTVREYGNQSFAMEQTRDDDEGCYVFKLNLHN